MSDSKNIFILGDSYSTFKGYIPHGYLSWYTEGKSEATDVVSVTQTWWWQLIDSTDSHLVRNDSWSGTTICNTCRPTKWENAVYVIGDKVYYFVRQWDPLGGNNGIAEGSYYGILTTYDLVTGEWHKPVLVGDSQSRSDFIVYNDELYLFHAPTNRNHIGILKINTDDIAKSEIVLQADMQGSCFYPFIQYNSKGELCMSYTVSRKHIRLASFTLSKYI